MIFRACDQTDQCIEALLPALKTVPASSPFHDLIAATWEGLPGKPVWPQTVKLYGMLFYNPRGTRDGVTPGRISINPVLGLEF